jgi:hypothetical protein
MKTLGISEAILLSELCYRRQFLARANKLTEDGFFYATVEDVEENTTLSDYAQRKILDKLRDKGLVTVERRGLPARRYICIHEEALQSLMDSITSANCPVPEDFGNKNPNSSALNNNNINNNDTNTLSKHNVLDTGHSHSSARSETSSSGKLFSSAKPATRKSSVQKTNNFITACQREAVKKKFSSEVISELDRYFIMLAQVNCLLPAVSIAEQLTWLQKVSADKQVSVIKNTISRGWKSLQYEAEAAIASKVPKWDTADPNAFTAKTEEEKNKDWREGVPDDHIF